MDTFRRYAWTRPLLLLILLTLAVPVAAQEATTLLGDDRALARLAWEDFVDANRPAEGGDGLLEWETWATATAVYAHRRQDNPPRWDEVLEREIENFLVQQVILERREKTRRGLDDEDEMVEVTSSPSEVRYNRVTFDWILLKNFWNLNGQLEQYEYLRKGVTVDVAFPAGSVAVKAVWKVLTGKDDPARYYTIDHAGHTYGLVAFHVIAKHLPDWFWATFEQVDNPGRSLVSHYDPYGYPQGDDQETSSDLRRLFEDAGMDPELWGHYRLNGSQMAFTDATGRPEVLANSVIEAGVTTRSSCMTCHSRTSVGEQGDRLAVEALVGDPDPSWFWTDSAERQPVYLALDFLWSLTRAQPLLPEKKKE
ncbi:MAG TPA: hypothetical protein VKU40_02025 [Thermoanaerobaculia bacterium]|nr:hypothetical protein [Thermoanaerobaculia bacterium]